jgi:UPF0271 protein
VAAARIDLNADIGEGAANDAELLGIVTSVSVACGAHAGDPTTMLRTAREAAGRGVTVGAHPAYADREGFGRRPLDVPTEELFAGVAYQVGAMAAVAEAAGTLVRFVKPHGALYNRAASDPAVAGAVVAAIGRLGLPLLCPAGSEMARMAERSGVTVYREAFADRGYQPDGRLVGRGAPGSLIGDPQEVAGRAVRLVERGTVIACDGSEIRVEADSICIHGDSPGAPVLAAAVRRALERAGVTVGPFCPPGG